MGEMRLEGPGHANGKRKSAGGSLAKLGSVMAGESSAIAAGSAQATRGTQPGRAARRQVAREELKKRISTAAIRVSWLRLDQRGA